MKNSWLRLMALEAVLLLDAAMWASWVVVLALLAEALFDKVL